MAKSTSGLDETEAIIDRFPIDLELRVGPTFTRRKSYTGIYNLMTLDISVRVECSIHYSGSNCTKFKSENLSENHTSNNLAILSKHSSQYYCQSMIISKENYGSQVMYLSQLIKTAINHSTLRTLCAKHHTMVSKF